MTGRQRKKMSHTLARTLFREAVRLRASLRFPARINTNFSWRDRNVELQPATVIELVDRPSGPWEGGTQEGNIKKRR